VKVPPDAFETYVGLGPGRSYQALADKLGVHKRTIVRHAKKEKWTERLTSIQEQARTSTDKKLAETLEEQHARHLKLLRAMSVRAATALRDFPLTTGMEAMRAAELVIKLERLIAGEPGERSELSIEEVTREEIQSLLVKESDDPPAR
jgi:transposase-like protein